MKRLERRTRNGVARTEDGVAELEVDGSAAARALVRREDLLGRSPLRAPDDVVVDAADVPQTMLSRRARCPTRRCRPRCAVPQTMLSPSLRRCPTRRCRSRRRRSRCPTRCCRHRRCPRRCCRLSRTCPRRCCRRRSCAPDDVVATSRGAPDDVVAAAHRAPARCCRRSSAASRRRPRRPSCAPRRSPCGLMTPPVERVVAPENLAAPHRLRRHPVAGLARHVELRQAHRAERVEEAGALRQRVVARIHLRGVLQDRLDQVRRQRSDSPAASARPCR